MRTCLTGSKGQAWLDVSFDVQRHGRAFNWNPGGQLSETLHDHPHNAADDDKAQPQGSWSGG